MDFKGEDTQGQKKGLKMEGYIKKGSFRIFVWYFERKKGFKKGKERDVILTWKSIYFTFSLVFDVLKADGGTGEYISPKTKSTSQVSDMNSGQREEFQRDYFFKMALQKNKIRMESKSNYFDKRFLSFLRAT